MVLIKDNHIDFAGSIAEAVDRVRAGARNLEIEVEARTLVTCAGGSGYESRTHSARQHDAGDDAAKRLQITSGVRNWKPLGNVTLRTSGRSPESGVDFISVGALTHSARVFDVSLKWAG